MDSYPYYKQKTDGSYTVMYEGKFIGCVGRFYNGWFAETPLGDRTYHTRRVTATVYLAESTITPQHTI